MSKVAEYRRENIRALIDQRGGQTRLSKAMGWKNSSFLAQQVGPNPTREVTEKTARRIEEVMRLEPGTRDRPPDGARPAPTPPAVSGLPTALVGEVIRMVGRAYEAEGVPLAPAKFSDLVALTLADSLARGGQPSEDHVRAVVRLLR